MSADDNDIDDDINQGQDDLMTRLEKAICSSTEEWDLTVVDVVGTLDCVKFNYMRIAAENADAEREEIEDREGEEWKDG